MKKKYTICKDNLINCKKLVLNLPFAKTVFIESLRAADNTATSLLIANCPDLKQQVTTQEVCEILSILVQKDKNLNAVKTVINEITPDAINYRIGTNEATLLHTSSLFGALKTIEFLLSKGSDVNALDNKSRTPIFVAVWSQQAEAIKLLINKNAKLDYKVDGRTVLHLAIMLQNNDIEGILIKANANKNIKFPIPNSNISLSYMQLKKAVKSKDISTDKIVPKYDIFEKINYYKGIAGYVKAVLAEDNNANYFIDAISKFKTELNNRSASVKGQMPSDLMMVTHASLKFLTIIYGIFKNDQSDSLKDYIIEKVISLKYQDILVILYDTLGKENIVKGDYVAGLKLLDFAYKICLSLKPNKNQSIDENDINQLKYLILFKLGESYKDFDDKKALGFFEEAASLSTNNDKNKALVEIVDINFWQNNKEKALEAIQYITESDLKDLLMFNSLIQYTEPSVAEYKMLADIHNFSRFGDGSSLKNTDMFKYILYSNIYLYSLIQDKNYTLAIKHASSIINEVILAPQNLLLQLRKLLQICQQAELNNEALEYLKSFYEKFPEIKDHGYPLLKYQEFVTYELVKQTPKADQCLAFLEARSSLGPRVKELFDQATKIRVCSEVENKNYKSAKHHLEKLNQLHNNKFLSYIIELLQHLEHKQEEANKIEKLAIQEDIVNANQNLTVLNWLEGTNDIEALQKNTENLDPKLIHQYFQQKKQQLLKEKLDLINNQKLSFSWKYQGTLYSTKDDIPHKLLKVEGKDNFYATIFLKLLKKLDQNQQKLFTDALKKGAISKEYNSNGIKFIPHKLVELKINGDLRLYTTMIFLNEQGKYLIVFDKKANHIKIAKLLATAKIEVVLADDTTCELKNPNDLYDNEVKDDGYESSEKHSDIIGDVIDTGC